MDQTNIRIHDVKSPYGLHNSQEKSIAEAVNSEECENLISQTVNSLERSSILPRNGYSRRCLRAKCRKEAGCNEKSPQTSKFNRAISPLKEFRRKRSLLTVLIPGILCIIMCGSSIAEGATKWKRITPTFEYPYAPGYSKGVYAYLADLRHSQDDYNRYNKGTEAIYDVVVLAMITLILKTKERRILSSVNVLMVFVLASKVEAADLNPVEWRWMTGASVGNQYGVCGNAGQYSFGYTPGSRKEGVITANGNYLFLFGGNGYATTGGIGQLGDVWVYRQTCWSCKGEWAWLGGKSNAVSYQGYYTGSTPIPGGRYASIIWFKPPNELHVHGGYGEDGIGVASKLSDLWVFNTETYTWVFLKGSSVRNQLAIYGTKGTPAADNVPGAVNKHKLLTSITDGTAFVFGGTGYDTTDTNSLCDTWKFTSTTQWAWINGPGIRNQDSVGGLSGVYSSTYYPGSRDNMAIMDTTHRGDLVYMFGGMGHSLSNFGRLADLWAFNTMTNEWAYIAGEATAINTGALGSYGSLGFFSVSNHPGSRNSGVGYRDQNSGMIFLFGGYGFDQNSLPRAINDFWAFNTTTKLWSWASGDSIVEQSGNYADSVWFSSTNKPSARQLPINGFLDLGLLFLLGGYDSASARLNDFWSTKGPEVVGVSPTVSPTATMSPNPTASSTATPSPEPTSPTATPTATPSPEPTSSPTAAPSPEPTTSPTVSPTTSPVISPTASPVTQTPTPSSIGPTPTSTASTMPSPTRCPTQTSLASPSSIGPTSTATSSTMVSPTTSPSPTSIITPTTHSPSASPTWNPTAPTPSLSPTASVTASPTTSATSTSVPTPCPIPSPTVGLSGGRSGAVGLDGVAVYVIIAGTALVGGIAIVFFVMVTTKRGRRALRNLFEKNTRIVVETITVNKREEPVAESKETPIIQHVHMQQITQYVINTDNNDQQLLKGQYGVCQYAQQPVDSSQLLADHGDVVFIESIADNGWAYVSIMNASGETESSGWYPVSWIRVMEGNPFGGETQEEAPMCAVHE